MINLQIEHESVQYNKTLGAIRGSSRENVDQELRLEYLHHKR